jgi:acyl dehydratase
MELMAEVSNLKHGSWDDARTLIGTTLAVIDGVDVATAGDMRRKLEVIGWDCPLHTDAEVARAHGYEDVVSPVSMARVWAMPAYWSPGTPRIGDEAMSTPIAGAEVPGVGDTLIATNARTEHHTPIYPGDRIRGTAVLTAVSEKQTRLGPGAFITIQTTYTNQRDETVSVETVTLLRYQQTSEDS